MKGVITHILFRIPPVTLIVMIIGKSDPFLESLEEECVLAVFTGIR